MKRFEALIVEDDPENWGKAVQSMYNEILSESEEDLQPIIHFQQNGRDAWNFLQAVEPDRLHLLSLDINLGLTHPTGDKGLPDTRQRGACGLDLLKVAASRNICRAVIVITGAAQDEKLPFVTRTQGELHTIQMSLEDHIQRYFPSRYKLFRKLPPSQLSVTEQLDHFKSRLSAKELLFLCRPQNEFVREAGGLWRVTFANTTQRIHEKDCGSGLRLIQHLIKFPHQEFSALALQAFRLPGELAETTEDDTKAKCLDAGLIPGKEGFKKLPNPKGPTTKEMNQILDSLLSQLDSWTEELKEYRDKGDQEQSRKAWNKASEIYRHAKELADFLHKDEAATVLQKLAHQHSFEEGVQIASEVKSSQPPQIRDSEELGGTRSQRTVAQQAQDAIARAVKQALRKIKECHPGLHTHLQFQQGIQIGSRRCVYSPSKRTEWFVENE